MKINLSKRFWNRIFCVCINYVSWFQNNYCKRNIFWGKKMDLSMFFSFIESNFWAQQIFTYSATALLDYSFAKLIDKSRKKDLSWQLLHCLQNAHCATCSQLNWEYDPNTFFEVSKKIICNNVDVCSETKLVNVFASAIEHPISINDVKVWINNFEIELASKEHEHLREFIKLKLLIKEGSISDIQRRYAERFEQTVFSDNNSTLSLYQLYIPNEYSLNDEDCAYDDLLQLIDSFINNQIEGWLTEKGIRYSNKINALFIFGHQCMGKSTLISKIIYDHYLRNELNSKEIYVVNFSDRSFRSRELTPRDICEY